MRRFFTLVVAATTAVLSLTSCGSDSDDSANKGGSGGSSNGVSGGHSGGHSGDDSGSDSGGAAGDGSTSQCVANNAEFTLSEFLAQTQADKACSSESDATSVCQNDMPVIGGTCGKGCLGMGDDAEQAECVAGCIQDALAKSQSEALSEDCLACYTADVECARKNCLTTCGLAPTSAACATCRVDNGCVAAFYACSGLPEPGGT